MHCPNIVSPNTRSNGKLIWFRVFRDRTQVRLYVDMTGYSVSHTWVNVAFFLDRIETRLLKKIFIDASKIAAIIVCWALPFQAWIFRIYPMYKRNFLTSALTDKKSRRTANPTWCHQPWDYVRGARLPLGLADWRWRWRHILLGQYWRTWRHQEWLATHNDNGIGDVTRVWYVIGSLSNI